MWRLVLVLVTCVSCGPGLQQTRRETTRAASDSLVKAVAERDVAAIAQHFGTPLAFGGMYFANPECLQKFPAPAVIEPAKHADFAGCLATLMLASSERSDEMDNVVVYDYAPGFEIEARFDDLGKGPQLTWIGYSGRRGLLDSLPTIGPSTLEAFRSEGDPKGTPSAEDATKLAAELSDTNEPAWAWLKICLDAEGAITNVHPREAITPLASKVFVEAVQRWKFKPLLLSGSGAIPACALVRLSHPPLETPEVLPVAFEVPENAIRVPVKRAHRVAGEKFIAPDDDAKATMLDRRIGRIIGSFGVCFGESGAVDSVQTIVPTGIASYDEKIAKTIKSTWKYRPFVVDGKPARACTAVTFVYSQSYSRR